MNEIEIEKNELNFACRGDWYVYCDGFAMREGKKLYIIRPFSDGWSCRIDDEDVGERQYCSSGHDTHIKAAKAVLKF